MNIECGYEFVPVPVEAIFILHVHGFVALSLAKNNTNKRARTTPTTTVRVVQYLGIKISSGAALFGVRGAACKSAAAAACAFPLSHSERSLCFEY